MTGPERARAGLGGGRGGLFLLALLVGVGAGLGAVAFRYLVYFFTWLATGHDEFGQQGYVGSAHLPALGLGFFVVIPVVGGLLYGPLIARFAPEARGHGVPGGLIAGGRKGVGGALLYGPLIARFAPEARGHGVPEVMIAVADNGGRIRPQVAVVKALASALCIRAGGAVGRE